MYGRRWSRSELCWQLYAHLLLSLLCSHCVSVRISVHVSRDVLITGVYDPNCYLLLSEAMDRMNLGYGYDSLQQALARFGDGKQVSCSVTQGSG